MSNQNQIAQQVVQAILAQKLAPGERLGAQELAELFGVSRTLVREALMQLQARGFVEVRARKGWYVGQLELARQRMIEHIGNVEAALRSAPDEPPQNERLRAALAPVSRPTLRKVG